MRIYASLLLFVLGITCATAQLATTQSQLSTNQTLSLYWTCNYPYATATDDQGIAYSTCAGNNGTQGILWTYRDSNGQLQTGWVTSPGNGSCYQSWGLSVSRDGDYVFATCYGNQQQNQIIGYEKQMNGSSWYWSPMSFNLSSWSCGRDIIYDSVTEDLYAICGTSLNGPSRIIRWQHNGTSDTYMNPQDLGIMANYLKYNPLNNYLYYATTSNIGYLVIHNDDGSSINMPNNNTMIVVNGTLTYWCEITSFTFSHNSTNTMFVGCTGTHNLLTSFTSYSILRIDMNGTWSTMNNTVVSNNNSTMMNSTNDSNTTTISNSTTITTTTSQVWVWYYTAYNISSTDSKAQGTDGNNDLTYPADGSCKGPSDMEVDSMNQLYVSCMQNADTRSVIRYTMQNSTYYLPAYVTTPAQCSHPQINSLTLTPKDDVIVSCSNNNIGLEFTSSSNTPGSNITITPTTSPSSGGNGNGTNTNGTNGTPTPTSGPTSSSGPTLPPGLFNLSSTSGFPNGTSGGSGGSSGPVCQNGVCCQNGICCQNGVCCQNGICSSSTGQGNNNINNSGMGMPSITFTYVIGLFAGFLACWSASW